MYAFPFFRKKNYRSFNWFYPNRLAFRMLNTSCITVVRNSWMQFTSISQRMMMLLILLQTAFEMIVFHLKSIEFWALLSMYCSNYKFVCTIRSNHNSCCLQFRFPIDRSRVNDCRIIRDVRFANGKCLESVIEKWQVL